ncbi:hypothetical protein KCP78_23745 [Salmonella enterica subsp. enterica]|nr:hypothetical protein KCP78_23745 [Salmonella enterica subsp. enterica]
MNETEAARHQREIARIRHAARRLKRQDVRRYNVKNERYEKAPRHPVRKTRETRTMRPPGWLLQHSQQQATGGRTDCCCKTVSWYCHSTG